MEEKKVLKNTGTEKIENSSMTKEYYEMCVILERAEIPDKLELIDEPAFLEYYGYGSNEEFIADSSLPSLALAEKEYNLARELWYILERVELFSESEKKVLIDEYGLDEFMDICEIIDYSLNWGHISQEMYDRLMYIFEITENPCFGYLFDLLCGNYSFFKGFLGRKR